MVKFKITMIYYMIFLSIILFSCKKDSHVITDIDKESQIENLRLENLILKQQIEGLQSELQNLNKNNNVNDEALSSSNLEVIDEKVSTGDKDQAINSIKYYLEMYHSGVEYDNLKAVPKIDKTIDIILDIIKRNHDNEIWLRNKKYYNVSTFNDNTYKINKEWGILL